MSSTSFKRNRSSTTSSALSPTSSSTSNRLVSSSSNARRRVTQSCVLLGIACGAIAFGALSNFSVLESIHVDLGAAIHEIHDGAGSRAQEIAAVRFDRRQSTTSAQAPKLTVDVASREHSVSRASSSNPSATQDPQPLPSSSDHTTTSASLVAQAPSQPRDDAHQNLAALWEAPSVGGCRNTGQGRRLVTDSQGFTCDRTTLSGADSAHQGCCPRHQRSLLALPSSSTANAVTTKLHEASIKEPATTAPEPWFGAASTAETALLQGNSGTMSRYSCASCDPTTQCCEVYELCVACCMAPQLQTQRDALQARSTHTAIRSLNDPFELCRYKCRTSSGSVVHENSYRSPAWKYCYGLERPPLQPGISMNSDLSFAIEMEKGKSAMVENPSQRLDPYVLPVQEARKLPPPPRDKPDTLLDSGSGRASTTSSQPSRLLGAMPSLRGSAASSHTHLVTGREEGLSESAPQIYPCRVDKCGAVVPRRYPERAQGKGKRGE